MTQASILVLENDPVTRERIARELRDLGYAVTESPDGVAWPGVKSGTKQSSAAAEGISVDVAGHRVIVDGDVVSLSPRGYQLLLFLLNNQDRVFSREELIVYVWNRDASVGVRTVDVLIRRLRSVLESYGYDRYVQTVRGTGYRFSQKI